MIGLQMIAVGKGVSAIADVWQARSDEYASYTASRRAAAMLVDASLKLIPIVTEDNWREEMIDFID